MKIDMQTDHPTINATDLAEFLNLTPGDVHNRMRDAQITNRPEIGKGKDVEKMRLHLFHQDIRLRLTCFSDGTMLKTSRTKTGAR